LEKQKTMGVDFELFLFPNNSDDGMFEHLLEWLTTEHHKGLLECFEGYQNCVSSKNGLGAYELPVQKTKMYAYIDTLKKTQAQQKAFKAGDWFFENTSIWNFDAPYLAPLKEFLKHTIL